MTANDRIRASTFFFTYDNLPTDFDVHHHVLSVATRKHFNCVLTVGRKLNVEQSRADYRIVWKTTVKGAFLRARDLDYKHHGVQTRGLQPYEYQTFRNSCGADGYATFTHEDYKSLRFLESGHSGMVG